MPQQRHLHMYSCIPSTDIYCAPTMHQICYGQRMQCWIQTSTHSFFLHTFWYGEMEIRQSQINKVTNKELGEEMIGRSWLLQHGTPGRPLSKLCIYLEDILWWRRERVAMKSSLEIGAFTNPLRYRKDLTWRVAWTRTVNSERRVPRLLEK